MSKLFLFKPTVSPELEGIDELSEKILESANKENANLEKKIAKRIAFQELNPGFIGYAPSVTLYWIASHIYQNTELDVSIFDQYAELSRYIGSFEEPKNIYKFSTTWLFNEIKDSDIIGISASTPDIPTIKKVFGFAKEKLGYLPTVVLGGPHASAMPVETLNELEFADIVVSGAGEKPLQMLVEGTAIEEIPNITYKKNGAIRQNKKKEFKINSDMKMETSWIKPTPTAFVFQPEYLLFSDMTSFSCPNKCAYCATPKYQNGPIFRNMDIVLSELEDFSEWGKNISVMFDDDTHFFSLKYVEALNKGLKERGLDIEKGAMMDPHLIDEPRIKICKENKYRVFIGRDYVTNLAAEKYGRRFMGEPRNVESEKEKIQSLIQSNIPTILSYIFPGPYDDMDYMHAVVSDMIDMFAPNVSFNFGSMIPFPGTEIRKIFFEKGLINENRINKWKQYDRFLYNDLTKINPDVKNWLEIQRQFYGNMVNSRLSNIWTDNMNKNELRLMAMVSAFMDKDLMNKLKTKITAQKQITAVK